MAQSLGEAYVTVSARGIGGVQRAFGGLSSSMMRWFGVAGIAGATAVATRETMNFHRAMTQVNTMMRLSPDQFKSLRQDVLDLSWEMGESPTSLAKSLYWVASGLFRGADSLKVMKAATEGAIVGADDLASVTQMLVGVLRAYDLQADDAGRTMAVLWKTVERGLTTMPEMSQSLGQVTALAAQMGVTVEELAASLAFLTRRGIQLNYAVTGMRAMFQRVIKPEEQALEISQKLGIAFDSAAVQTKGWIPWLRELYEKTGGNEKILARLFGRIQGVATSIALLSRGTREVEEDLAGMKNATEDFADALKIVKESTPRAWDEFKNSMKQVVPWYVEQIDEGIKKTKEFVGTQLAPKTPETTGLPTFNVQDIEIARKKLEKAEAALYRFANMPGARLRMMTPGIRAIEQMGLETRTAEVDRLQALVNSLQRGYIQRMAREDVGFVTGGWRERQRMGLEYVPEFQRYYPIVIRWLEDISKNTRDTVSKLDSTQGQ